VLARVRGEQLDKLGMLMDFGVLKKHLRELADELDHLFLNEKPPFDAINPTSENLAKYMYEELAKRLPPGVRPYEMTVWESPTSAATYRPE
jgi:6-pyruvoyltetrahydropterin/6-carboxytetrahydropterin synthase